MVGEDIDDAPQAVAFVAPAQPAAKAARPELWIGHRWCLNVIRSDYSVDRVGGYEGLPVGNITALVAGAEPGTLWIGYAAAARLHAHPQLYNNISSNHQTLITYFNYI